MNDKCEIFSYLINDYLDGTLSKEDSEKLKQHLSECKDCSEELKELKETIEMVASLKHLNIPETPGSFSQDIISKLEEEKKVIPVFFNKYAAASIIAMVVIGVMAIITFSQDGTNLAENQPQTITKTKPTTYTETIIAEEYGEDFYTDNSIIAETGLPTDDWGLLNLDGM